MPDRLPSLRQTTAPAPLPRALRVHSADELRRALRGASHRPLRLDSSGMDRVLRQDATLGLVEVQAGIKWRALAAALARGDAAFAALGEDAFGETIGESIACNAAGPDGRALIAHIESLTLVTADGELRRASRQAKPELFALVVGGQGVFGELYSVTLRSASLAASLASRTPPAVLALEPCARGASLESDLLVPPARLDETLAQVRALAVAWRLALCRLSVRRTLPEAESVLRWAREEYAAVHLCLRAPGTLGGCVRAAQLERMLIDVAIANGGSFPIATTRAASRAQLEACYPGLRAFLAEKRRLDPGERFENAWYRHHRALMRREPCEVRWGVPAPAAQ